MEQLKTPASLAFIAAEKALAILLPHGPANSTGVCVKYAEYIYAARLSLNLLDTPAFYNSSEIRACNEFISSYSSIPFEPRRLPEE